MFTGLIQKIGIVRTIEKTGDWRIGIEVELPADVSQIGASIACSGVCLTLIDKTLNQMWLQVSSETLSTTTIGSWVAGSRVNIEPSLRVGDALGGHFVSGHVDGIATLTGVVPEGDSHRMTITPPPALMRFIAPKGSVALDGVSLTVNEVGERDFGVNIIPHTWDHTTLEDLRAGSKMNIEVDILARYAVRALRVSS